MHRILVSSDISNVEIYPSNVKNVPVKGSLPIRRNTNDAFETGEERSNPPMHSKWIGKVQIFWNHVWEICLYFFPFLSNLYTV